MIKFNPELTLIIMSCVLLLSNLTQGQNVKEITIGKIDSIYSGVLKEPRTILVHLPMTPPDDFNPHQKYPVVYVLDGEVLFHSVVAITEQLGGGSGNYNFPKVIVVGITNTDRTRDLTPTHSEDATIMPAFMLTNSGGGQNFLSFLEKELIPYIESQYPAAPYRVLIGHSAGGLMAINALIHHNYLFNAFVAIDPSMWWDKLTFLNQTKDVVSKDTFRNTSLFMAIANNMPKNMSLQQLAQDTSAQSLPMRSIMQLDTFLKEKQPHKLRYQSKYYTEYNHGSVPLVAEYDALPFIFSFYGMNLPFPQFFELDYENEGIFTEHYKTVSRKMSYEVLPPGELIYAVASQLMHSNQLNRAEYFFQLNIENYPDSYKVYETMGDFYAFKGDKTKAKAYYAKALTKKDILSIRTKIDELKTK
jgi:hypothetical protein